MLSVVGFTLLQVFFCGNLCNAQDRPYNEEKMQQQDEGDRTQYLQEWNK
jgi:hypothetical protein